MPMPTQPVAPAPAPARHDMSVVLVTGSYDHEIRFWEAWSGICSRTIARSGESGVRPTLLSTLPLSPPSYDVHTASKSSRHLSRVRPRVSVSVRYPNPIPYSKRLLAAAIHKKVNIYEIASSSSTPVIGSSIIFTRTLLK
jgi:G protein beta subunit-like protein